MYHWVGCGLCAEGEGAAEEGNLVKVRYVAPSYQKATGFFCLLVFCITLFPTREGRLTQELG